MRPDDGDFLLAILLAGLLEFTFVVYLADRKGYDAWNWVFVLPPFGLLILPFLPTIRRPKYTRHEADRLCRRGNEIGDILSAATVLLIFLVFFGIGLYAGLVQHHRR